MNRLRFSFTPPSNKFGMGHYSRILAIAELLDSSGRVRRLIEDSGRQDSGNPRGLDWETCGDFEWDGHSSWWIFDLSAHGEFGDLADSITRQSDFRILVIDHFHRFFIEPDIHIQPSPVPTIAPVRAKSQYFGWEFILSRFSQSGRALEPERHPRRRGIVLTGGADSLGVLPAWLAQLASFQNSTSFIDVVKGRFATTSTLELPENIRLLEGLTKYPKSFARYSLGLVVHGVSTFDLLVSGVPAVVMPNPKAKHLEEVAALSSLGIIRAETNPKNAAQTFLTLMHDGQMLQEMSDCLAPFLARRREFDFTNFLNSH